jgi:hypothetical protein
MINNAKQSSIDFTKNTMEQQGVQEAFKTFFLLAHV